MDVLEQVYCDTFRELLDSMTATCKRGPIDGRVNDLVTRSLSEDSPNDLIMVSRQYLKEVLEDTWSEGYTDGKEIEGKYLREQYEGR